MADIELKLKINADGTAAVQQIRGVSRAVDGLGREAKSAAVPMGNLKEAIAGFAIGVASISTLSRAVTGLYRVNAEAQRLGASLETVTGSAEAAAKAWADLARFAATTPFELQQSVQAFTRLKAVGLDPGIEALRAYGDTASAMGFDLLTMVDAVVAATNRELDPLKKFGIVARQEADQITFTFKGVETTIGNNAQAIEGYLRRLGELEFSGGMERQMKTLGGASSNLSDALFDLGTTIGEVTGLNDLFAASLRNASSNATSLANLFKGLGFRTFATDADKFNAVFERSMKLRDEYMLRREALPGIIMSGASPQAVALAESELLDAARAWGASRQDVARMQQGPLNIDINGAGSVAPGGGAGAAAAQNARDIVLAAERAAGLPPGALLALWGVESSYSTNTGLLGPQTKYGRAVGPFQILPSTARALGLPDIANASLEEQAKASAAYLAQGMGTYGNLPDAYRFYHGGPNTALWGPKTNAYAAKAQGIRAGYLAESRLPDEEGYAAVLERQELLLAGAEERERALAAVRAEGQQVIAATRTDTERYAAELERLSWLYRANAIDAETLQRATKQVAEEFLDTQSKTSAWAGEVADVAARAFGDLAASFGDTDDVLKRILLSFRDLIIQLTIVKPLAEAFAAALGGEDGKGGFIGSITSGLGKGAGEFIAGLIPFADGGTVHAALPHGIYTRPTMFPMREPGVHAYAAGVGLLGEAGYEAVLPLTELPNGKLGVHSTGGGARVVVHNYSPERVEARPGLSGDDIELVVGAMADRIQRGGNAVSQAIEGRYGLGRGR